MCRCADAADVPMCRCANVPMCRCAYMPMSKIKMFDKLTCGKRSILLMCRCADVPICPWEKWGWTWHVLMTNCPYCRCADVPICPWVKWRCLTNLQVEKVYIADVPICPWETLIYTWLVLKGNCPYCRCAYVPICPWGIWRWRWLVLSGNCPYCQDSMTTLYERSTNIVCVPFVKNSNIIVRSHTFGAFGDLVHICIRAG